MTSKETIDVVLAAKALVERDLRLGLVKEEELRFTIQARRQTARDLVAKGYTHQQIADFTGVERSTITKDLVQNSHRSIEKQKEKDPSSVKNAPDPNDVMHSIERNTVYRKVPAEQPPEPEPEKKTTRELLAQSDQNDWRTPRKFLDAALNAGLAS